MTAPYPVAERLENELGDADDPHNEFGVHAGLVRDAAGEFPEDFRQAVIKHGGLNVAFVPAEHGGPGITFDDTMMRVRVAARRDVCVMPATMFSITAATCVLLSGNAEQRKQVLSILDEGGAVAFALSEPDHGADVVAGSCSMTPTEDGHAITGRKWMVGLGLRCDAAYVVVRTGGRGPAAFTGVLLDADDLATSRASNALLCTGMRGIDFGDFAFDAQPVTQDQLVGEPGRGLIAALRALQIVRITGTAANLACTDTVLRLTLAHAYHRRVGNRRLLEHRRARHDLAVALAWHFAADVAAITAARAVHVCPQSISHLSSIAKTVATTATAAIMSRCADTLGTWSVVPTGPGAIFAKMRRDADTLRYVDTGPEATLRTLSAQLPSLLAGTPLSADAAARVEAVTNFGQPLPEYRPQRLELFTRGADDVTTAFEDRFDDVAANLADHTRPLLDDARRSLRELRDGIRAPGADVVGAAESFAALHTAASCVLVWSANRGMGLYGGTPGASGWLDGTLAVLTAAASGRTVTLAAQQSDALIEHGRLLLGAHHLLTALPVRLAGEATTTMEEDHQ